MRRPGLLLLMLAAVACGPTAGHRAQQTLAPAVAADSAPEPLLACVEAVLAGSPLIERQLTRRAGENPRKHHVKLRNPPGLLSTSLGFAVEPARGTPREFVVEFVWPGRWQGTNGMKPPPDPRASEIEGQMMADIGAELLRQVRSECAPTAPGEPVCSKVAQGRSGRCVLGA